MPDDPNDPGTNEPGANDPPSGGTTATFTQDQVNAIATREADKAKRAAAKALLEELGFSSKDDLAKFVGGVKEAERAQMTEAERMRSEAEAIRAQADADRQAIATERHTTAVERALIQAGVPVDKTGRLTRLVDVETGADADSISDAVAAFKAEFPAMFGQPAGSPSPSSAPAAGGPSPVRTNQQLSPWERGVAEAARFTKGRTP